MENARCRAFIECVEKGSISAAAEALGYTPSAVSQLIAGLEKELGLKLLNRSQKGVKLTSEGAGLVPLIRAYLAREREIYQYASELKGVVMGNLTIASYPSVATHWLPQVVRQFKNDFPGVHINIKEGVRPDIFKCFEQNEADLAFLVYADPMPYEWIPLAEVPLLAALPEDHPLAGLEKFPVKECENYDFILGSWGNELEVINVFNKYDIHPDIKYTTQDTPATLAMVKMGLGISLVNALSARIWNEHLVKIPLDPPENITFGIAIPSMENLSNAARKFLSYAVRMLSQNEEK